MGNKHKAVFGLPCAIGVVLLMFGCSPTQKAFLTIRVCPVTQQGIGRLSEIMREAAESESLRFFDDSQRARTELETVGAGDDTNIDLARLVDLHIEGKKGLGATASNLGLPPDQIAIGFTSGADRKKARRLSERLVRNLSSQWDVQTVPQGQGVLPSDGC